MPEKTTYIGLILFEKVKKDGAECVELQPFPSTPDGYLKVVRSNLKQENGPAILFRNLSDFQITVTIKDIDNPNKKPYSGVFDGPQTSTDYVLTPAGSEYDARTIGLLTGIGGGETTGEGRTKWTVSMEWEVGAGGKKCSASIIPPLCDVES